MPSRVARSWFRAALACAALTTSPLASASDAPDVTDASRPVLYVRQSAPNRLDAGHGLELGLRVGVAHPGGMLGEGSSATVPAMSSVAEAAIPFGVDAGYRFSPRVYLGGSLVWAPAFGDDSTYCVACNFRYDLQVLAELRLYPVPEAVLSPWFSFGPGWEVLHVSFFSSADASYQGPVLGNLQMGVDLRKRKIAVGPYVGFALATFLLRSLDPSPPREPSPNASIHEWFSVGLHGSYGP